MRKRAWGGEGEETVPAAAEIAKHSVIQIVKWEDAGRRLWWRDRTLLPVRTHLRHQEDWRCDPIPRRCWRCDCIPIPKHTRIFIPRFSHAQPPISEHPPISSQRFKMKGGGVIEIIRAYLCTKRIYELAALVRHMGSATIGRGADASAMHRVFCPLSSVRRPVLPCESSCRPVLFPIRRASRLPTPSPSCLPRRLQRPSIAR